MDRISYKTNVTVGLLGIAFTMGMVTIPFFTIAVGYLAAQALVIVAIMHAAKKATPAFIPQTSQCRPNGTVEMSEALAA